MPKIHPTAIVDAAAQLADDVEIGPYSVVEADVVIGRGCLLRPGAIIRRYTTMGEGNVVDSGAVLGGWPQDLKFDARTVSYLRIGDRNIFRENVTISRATGEGAETLIGNDTYWMSNSHAGHNVIVGDGVILANNGMLAGFTRIDDHTIVSGGTGVHQFVRIGRRVMTQGNASITNHVPPYTMVAGINCLVGLNRVGIDRAEEISDEDARQIKEAFELTYRRRLSKAEAIEKMDACSDWGAPAAAFREFIRWAVQAQPPFNRGLVSLRRHR
jgi:UDP-N-acetylglucosamine acyltransferase